MINISYKMIIMRVVISRQLIKHRYLCVLLSFCFLSKLVITTVRHFLFSIFILKKNELFALLVQNLNKFPVAQNYQNASRLTLYIPLYVNIFRILFYFLTTVLFIPHYHNIIVTLSN